LRIIDARPDQATFHESCAHREHRSGRSTARSLARKASADGNGHAHLNGNGANGKSANGKSTAAKLANGKSSNGRGNRCA
jgi:hypothetical protein